MMQDLQQQKITRMRADRVAHATICIPATCKRWDSAVNRAPPRPSPRWHCCLATAGRLVLSPVAIATPCHEADTCNTWTYHVCCAQHYSLYIGGFAAKQCSRDSTCFRFGLQRSTFININNSQRSTNVSIVL